MRPNRSSEIYRIVLTEWRGTADYPWQNWWKNRTQDLALHKGLPGKECVKCYPTVLKRLTFSGSFVQWVPNCRICTLFCVHLLPEYISPWLADRWYHHKLSDAWAWSVPNWNQQYYDPYDGGSADHSAVRSCFFNRSQINRSWADFRPTYHRNQPCGSQISSIQFLQLLTMHWFVPVLAGTSRYCLRKTE